MEIMSNHLVRVKSNREWKVLVVDYDRVCLTILEKMLRTACNYHVTISNNAKDVTSLLKDQNNNFDIVIIDVYVPHMDGLEFLKQICEQIDIPVIAMSSYADEDLIKDVFKAGACDCLVKPIRLENVRHIWINVYRAQSNGAIKRVEQSRSNSVTELINNDQSNNNPGDYGKTSDGIKSKNSDGEKSKFKKKKLISTNDVGDNQQINDDASTKKKKPRIIWTPELHEKFVAAVKQFGNSKAVPKKILELMNVPGLTRENVASHLQKYRQCHKQLDLPFLKKRGNRVKLVPLQEQSHISISPTNAHPNIQTQTQTQTQVISTSSLQVRSFPTQIDLYGSNHETLKHMTHAMKIQAMSNESMVFGENSSSKTDMNMAIVKHVEGSNVIYHPWSTTFSMEDNVNKEATSFFAREQCVNYGYGYENLLDLGYNDAPFCFEQIDHNSYAH